MAIRLKTLTSAAAMTAALSLAATPAAAAELPAVAYGDAQIEIYDEGDLNHHRSRRYRNRRGGVSAGDVVAGVVVLGALASILGSSRSRDRDRYEDRQPQRTDDRRSDYESRGIERAVDMCIDQIDRGDTRVESVENAQRGASGWNVSGTLENGGGWTCLIDNDGRIRDIDFGQAGYSYSGEGQAYAASAGGDQHSEDYYARARATTRTATDGAYTYQQGGTAADTRYETARADGPQPAYPGAPVGDEDDRPEWDGDGRYTTAQAPDFQQ